MKRLLILPAVMAVFFIFLSYCTLPGDDNSDPTPAVYSVTYDGNGSTEGSEPVDNSSYEQGEIVTVLDNTGVLRKAEVTGRFSRFGGWNTQTDGNGINYAPGETFSMGDADVVLYAVWLPPLPY